MTAGGPGAAEYILPLRWTEDSALPDLAEYLRRLTAWIPVTVVDGSCPGLFEHHRSLFPSQSGISAPTRTSRAAGATARSRGS